MFSYSTDRGNQQHGGRGSGSEIALDKSVREREIARQQSVSERRQGANRTSSDVHLENVRLEAPPEVSACPPPFEAAAQATHTMLVKMSQNSLSHAVNGTL